MNGVAPLQKQEVAAWRREGVGETCGMIAGGVREGKVFYREWLNLEVQRRFCGGER